MLHTCYAEGIDGCRDEDSSMGGAESSVLLKWNLISFKWNKLTQITS